MAREDRTMSTTLIGPAIKQVGDTYELKLVLPPETLAELDLAQDEPMVLEVDEGKLVIRRATFTEQTAGIGAPWRIYPPLTPEEENDAFERAVTEENSRYE
jgi:antitoxin component of MazEF toxin-antitoxin module